LTFVVTINDLRRGTYRVRIPLILSIRSDNQSPCGPSLWMVLDTFEFTPVYEKGSVECS